MDLQALWLTFRLAFTTTLILLVVAIPLAGWLVLSRARWKPLVEALAGLPLLLPPTVLGFYLLVLLGPRTAPGRYYEALTGHQLTFSFAGLVVGSVLYSLPFALQPMTSGFAAIDQSVIDAAVLLGAGPLRLLLHILLPLARRSVLAAAVLAFTHTVGEFGVVLMIGGDIPGSTRTLSISIFDQVQDFAYAQANRTALVLLLFSFVALLLLYWRRSGASNA
ncbi:MAG TPA: molybdate ABC transporter permease subunit [Acidisarcina sp.]|nr:molybdate ABC transporter permease subunit [Acidisarcina sp.]